MKSIYTLLLFGIFFTSCKKEDAKPATTDPLLTLTINNNSAATLNHVYAKHTGDGYENLSDDILNGALTPGNTKVIKLDKAFTNTTVFEFTGSYTKIVTAWQIEDKGGTTTNQDDDGYSKLNFLNTKPGEHITITIE